MKMFSTFRSPSWEQRDPDKRAVAVRDEQAPELLAKLPQIAATDESPAVRRAALARLADVGTLLERTRAETDAATRTVATTRLSKLLLDPGAGLAFDARRDALPMLPADLVERIAESAPETELRRAALQRVSRAGFLQRRAVDDPDAALREEALSRIEGEDVLERLAESLRKRDKHLARRARERVFALRVARGDAATLQQYALELCESLAQWAQQLPDDIEAKLDEARTVYAARRELLDDAMQRRVEAYFERVQAARARRETRAEEAARPAPEPVIEVAPAAPAPVQDFSAFDLAVRDAERAVQAQKLGEVRPAVERAKALLPTLPRSDRTRREKLARVEEKLDELDQWQRWSGNRVRARLCDDVEALIVAAPHPDAVAHRVRELQAEWAKVEAAEPGDADRTSGLARRFRALCGRAMAPTKAYFDQRHALREQKREGYETLLSQADDVKLAALPVTAIVTLRRKLGEGLRGLDELEPKVRSALARRLRDALTRIDSALDAQREDAALARRKLVARLRRELTHADPATSLHLARDAQQEWKTLPRAAKDAEAALEAELKSLLDPLFAREREEREREQSESVRIETESKRLLAEIEALSQGDADTLAHAEGRIAALQLQWRDLHAAAQAAADAQRRESRGPRGGLGDARGRSDTRGPGDTRGRTGARGDTRRPDTRRAGAASTSGDAPNLVPDSRGHGEARGNSEPRGDRYATRGARDRDARGARSNTDARPPRPVDIDRPFDQAVARVRQAQGALEASRRGSRLQAIAQAAALFARVTHGEAEKTDDAWTTLELDDADRRRLQARWQSAAPQEESALLAHDGTIDTWLVDAELDASLDSPVDAQPLRRQRQMQRLANRLQGAAATAPDTRERLLQYALLPTGSAAKHAERERRLQRVLDTWTR